MASDMREETPGSRPSTCEAAAGPNDRRLRLALWGDHRTAACASPSSAPHKAVCPPLRERLRASLDTYGLRLRRRRRGVVAAGALTAWHPQHAHFAVATGNSDARAVV